MIENIKNYLIKNNRMYKKGIISKKMFIKTNYEKFHSKLFQYQDYLHKTEIKNIEISKNEVIFTMYENEIKMILPKKDIRSTPLEILNFRQYESKETNMIKLLLKKKSIFIDVGANFGWYSLLLSKQFPRSKIYSFEPIKNTYKYFKKNIVSPFSEV